MAGSGQEADYYWRDYTGVIPKDAIPGGYDNKGQTTYIGQAFVKEEGIIPGIIYPGKKSMVVDAYGIRTSDVYLKILCSSQLKNFMWMKTTSSTFYADTKNRHPVKGGIERTYLLYLGRVAVQGEIILGKIVTPSSTSAPIYYINNNKATSMQSFEALVYMP